MSFRKNVITIFLLGVVYLWYFVSHATAPTQKPVNVLGADTNISVFIQPQAGRQPIIDAINSAQKEILVEVYLLSDKQIIDALENAKQKGVIVNVMLEEHPFGGGNLNNKTQKELLSKGVSVSWTHPAFLLTHEKTIVIDGAEAFILNQNLTAASFTKNREYNVIDTNPKDVLEIRTIFIDDWKRQSFTSTSSNLVVSPNNSRPKITGLLESGQKSIDIEDEDIVDDQIVSILSEKAKNIQVRVVVPTLSQISSNKKDLDELKAAGVLIKTVSSPYIHAKLILIDDKKAYIGSVNLSSQSMDKNREVGIILSTNDAISSFSSTFSDDFAKGKDY